ncbi:hypothetical protein GCM10022255_006340 [Dactylosporangium darangshiense]|uniref:Uncharacterized protein n=1 Tax=Dactylosporangium darangshiense TaxID=579108 RepID=A0ABP8CW98_9ACTN
MGSPPAWPEAATAVAEPPACHEEAEACEAQPASARAAALITAPTASRVRDIAGSEGALRYFRRSHTLVIPGRAQPPAFSPWHEPGSTAARHFYTVN